MQTQRRTIENILLIDPLIYGLQEGIEKEQDRLINDLVSPAEKVVRALIELDNRRIDLCNLRVLNGYIQRGLGPRFEVLRSCVFSGTGCDLYGAATEAIAAAGYDVERVWREFGYLFKHLRRPKKAVKAVTATLHCAAARPAE